MEGVLISSISALWLGIMTSISPCPLATNVAAISFLSKKITHPFLVLFSGIAYTIGRVVSYAALGFLIIGSIMTIPQAAQFLQMHAIKFLGPVLIITGLVLTEALRVKLPSLSLVYGSQSLLAKAGAPGAFLLGAVFALAFCPVSAALFFGSLIPLALKSKFGAILPFIYGIGTGIPVVFFTVMIALGIKSIGHWFSKITKIERYMRKAAGVIFIVAGIYYFMIYSLKIII
jgi:cytochrome c biogenesis protein CcdA